MGFTPEELQRFEALLEKNEARAGRPREYRLAEQVLKESQRWPATCTHGEEYCRVCVRDEIIAAERERCAKIADEWAKRMKIICEISAVGAAQHIAQEIREPLTGEGTTSGPSTASET